MGRGGGNGIVVEDEANVALRFRPPGRTCLILSV